ncbi:hypothetical protein IDH06_00570 [Pelagibacterales bacterium SAG-MED25]|mgnify:FL=1|uniref:hypothetical protein n=1 Tax=Pelagibacter sp. (strain HTCC7211) TaxID=439493 RepID=UPI0002DCED2B|nr:hypothetical protein [Candidatus Pelagibacter sp. HTCC7211]MBD1150888.1 hypothetical protein [Pelagibacterales bacterium SAG-MED25]|tara:strand:- start:1345 stop:1632 length:288 start_codon:yes stop_codon:yes gene_type:complete
MSNKEDELFKFVKEWENKDYNEFNRNFEAFVEKLELSYEETKEISLSLDAESYKDGSPNSGSAHLQYAADFFVMILEDYDNNNESDDSRKYLINE